jgi:hypothetical protein
MPGLFRVVLICAVAVAARGAGAAEGVSETKLPVFGPEPAPPGYIHDVTPQRSGPAEEKKDVVEEEYFVDLVSEDLTSRIPSLKWDSDTFRVKRVPHGEEFLSFVTLKGVFGNATKDWALSNDKVIFETDEGGRFEVEVPLQGKVTYLKLMAIGPLGEIEKEKVAVYLKDYHEFKREAEQRPVKKYFLSSGVGFTSLSFKDSRKPDFSQLALTGKISFLTPVFPPRWDFGFTTYLTLVPLTSNQPKSARFLGVNFRIGYVLPGVKDPWRVTLLGGLYYTTMFVSTGDFGFQNLAGPQLFPVVMRTFRNRDSALAYLKFSPVGTGFGLITLYNHEKAVGGAYIRPLEGGRTMSASIDIAQLQLRIGRTTQVSSSVTVGVGYGL